MESLYRKTVGMSSVFADGLSAALRESNGVILGVAGSVGIRIRGGMG